MAKMDFSAEDISIIRQGLELLAASHKRRVNTEKNTSVAEIYNQLLAKTESLNLKIGLAAPVNPNPHS